MSTTSRFLKSLSKQGLDVTREGDVYDVQIPNTSCRVLLPDSLPGEGKAFAQLAQAAGVRHPGGGCVCKAIATPDLHPGDSGVAIGTVVEQQGIVTPQMVGSDINCGMRLHSADLDVGAFAAGRDKLVALLKGDLFEGTRDLPHDARTQHGMFRHGLFGWHEAASRARLGNGAHFDYDQILSEVDSRVYSNGMLDGDSRWAPHDLVPADLNRIIRDDGICTVGGGNHFIEVQVVDEILDRTAAYNAGLAVGRVSFMIHSGSRFVGKYVGQLWLDKARAAWPAGARYPESKIFPIAAGSDLFEQYLQAEATAANYGFVNRMLLAEIVRLRMRQVFGKDLQAPLVYDVPHNITLREHGRLVSRKGACPAHDGQIVIIPGSMGHASYVLQGRCNHDWLCSASHGAGRARSRSEMRHEDDLGLEGLDVITLRQERKIEEAPAAYKDISAVVDAQIRAGIVTPIARLRPLLTFKA